MLNNLASKNSLRALCISGALTLTLSACGGHGNHSSEEHHGDEHEEGHHGNEAIGVAGEASEVDRTIEVVMNDGMRFVPASINVKAGKPFALN